MTRSGNPCIVSGIQILGHKASGSLHSIAELPDGETTNSETVDVAVTSESLKPSERLVCRLSFELPLSPADYDIIWQQAEVLQFLKRPLHFKASPPSNSSHQTLKTWM